MRNIAGTWEGRQEPCELGSGTTDLENVAVPTLGSKSIIKVFMQGLM